MEQYATEKPKKWPKILGGLAAAVLGTVALFLVMTTQEPKKAVSSPTPTATPKMSPQVADSKMATEVPPIRGKSFSLLKRTVTFPYAGEIVKVVAREGQAVEKGDLLLEYHLDRQSLQRVHQILYPDAVLTLKKNRYERQISVEKLREINIPVKKLEVERLEKELSDLRELRRRNLAAPDQITLKERQIQTAKKEIQEIEETIKQQEADLQRISEDLKFQEEKQKREIDLLEWQTNRSYRESDLPIKTAYLQAPIAGHVVWLSPDALERAESPVGFHACTVAPMNPMIVRCQVHELEVVKLKVGDRASLIFDAMPEKKFSCKVSRIPWSSKDPTVGQPANYDVECELENVDAKLKDGLTCEVKFSLME